jgi:hypothetical protein
MKAGMAFAALLLICVIATADDKNLATSFNVDKSNPNPNLRPTGDQLTDGRLEILAQERRATLAGLRALPENPQDAEIAAKAHRLKEDLASLDREIARVRFPNVAVPRVRPQTDTGVRASHGANLIAPLLNADAGRASYQAWDVFRNFPSKESE